jgi:hypothetical protein
MATFPEIQQDLTDVGTAVTGIAAGLDAIDLVIQSLRDQVAAGGVLTQAELDGLDAEVQRTRTVAQDALTRVGTMGANPVPPAFP